ncbi:MAG: plasmid pRiA4b ORF-3 family protein [Ferruginibacter sp.]|nr:plasmid pRiA4b ORF-3 family protein [Ferruginibacter sp.]
MKEIIQLHVSLQGSKPLIWRSILVNEETSFFELHHIIQIAMGWKNYHLFEFNLDGYRVGMIEENGEQYGSNLRLDANKTLLKDVVSLEKDNFLYNYDFGDGWLHEIELKHAVDKNDNGIYPACISGQLNCPPEDCGGIGRFYNILKILQNKKHPEYKETKIWVGKKYDPESFDPLKVNKQLKQLKRYISRWNSPE